jgi:chromosome segregation ATPase
MMINMPSRDWRKRSHRIEQSRDSQKIKNREKATRIKALEGKASDLETSREQWKKKYETKVEEIKKLADEIAAKDKLVEAEKALRQQEAAAYAAELDRLKKKWEMLQQVSLKKQNKRSLTDTIRQYLS